MIPLSWIYDYSQLLLLSGHPFLERGCEKEMSLEDDECNQFESKSDGETAGETVKGTSCYCHQDRCNRATVRQVSVIPLLCYVITILVNKITE